MLHDHKQQESDANNQLRQANYLLHKQKKHASLLTRLTKLSMQCSVYFKCL